MAPSLQQRIQETYEKASVDRDASWLPVLRELLDESLREGDADDIGRVTLGLVVVLRAQQLHSEASEVLDQVLAMPEASPQWHLHLLTYRMALSMDEGRMAEAIGPGMLAWRLAMPENVRAAAIAATNLAFCLADLRDFEGAHAWFDRARVPGIEPFDLAHVYWGRGMTHVWEGDPVGLAQAVRGIHDLDVPPDAFSTRVDGMRDLLAGWLEVLEDRPAQGAVLAERARERLWDGSASDAAECLLLWSRAARLAGDPQTAARVADEALTQKVDDGLLARIHQERAEAARVIGDLEGVIRHLDAANRLHRESRTLLSFGPALRRVLERLEQMTVQREDELTASNEALQRARSGLERRVAERTAELSVEVEVRRAAERQAKRASEAKSRFLASISHELRTPLNAILGYTELLADEIEDPDHVADLGRIEGAGRQLLGLIDDLLDLTQIEQGTVSVRPVPTDLVQVLKGITHGLRTEPGLGTLSLHLEGLGTVHTDPIRVGQLVSQLLKNAGTHGGGVSVELRAERLADSIRIEVRDQGPGISEDRLRDLFDPFAAADPSRVGTLQFGLARCRVLAEALGGSLAVESRQGEGTCVRVVLPASSVSA